MKTDMKTNKLTILIILLLLAVGILSYIYWPKSVNPKPPKQAQEGPTTPLESPPPIIIKPEEIETPERTQGGTFIPTPQRIPEE